VDKKLWEDFRQQQQRHDGGQPQVSGLKKT
jgi:hypothetical protein